jgi:hypothetical protein
LKVLLLLMVLFCYARLWLSPAAKQKGEPAGARGRELGKVLVADARRLGEQLALPLRLEHCT